MTGGLHEAHEREVCDRVLIHPEAFDGCRMGRRLLGVVLVRAHGECAAGDPDNVLARISIPSRPARLGSFDQGLRFVAAMMVLYSIRARPGHSALRLSSIVPANHWRRGKLTRVASQTTTLYGLRCRRHYDS